MDNKRLILNVTFVLALFLAWNFTIKALYKAHPNWKVAATTAPAATVPPPATAPAVASTAVEPTTGPTTGPTVAGGGADSGTGATGLHAEDTPGPAAVTLGSAAFGDPTFPMSITLDPRGAGLGRVVLNDYYETAKQEQLYAFEQPDPASPDDTRPLATRSVTVDGHDVDLTDAHWRQTASSDGSASFATRILDGAKPVLELTKTFTLLHRDAADGSRGYDVAITQSFRNLTDHPLSAVSLSYNGPTAPTAENSRSEDRRFVAGFDEGDHVVKTDDTFVNELSKAKGTVKDLATGRPLPLLWVGTCNSYFDAIVRPDSAGTAGTPPVAVASAPAVGLDDTTHDAAFNLTTTPFAIPVGATVPFNVHAFFGPKQRALLKNDYYSAYPRAYDETLVYISKWCGLLTFGWLINALYGILWFFHKIFFDWGLAIICLVVLVRSCLHPITKRSQINMMGMSKMGPEIERLKKKYGDDKEGLNKAMMSVYKEQGMVPILGCLPMLLQTPIWLALWAALQSTFEMRQAGFLRWGHVHLTWIADLSQPDALYTFPAPVHLLMFTVHSVNVLPILLAGVFFLQQMMQPVPPNQTPEQEQQRKMMRWMSLMYPIFFYVSPSGLTLYILTSTSIGIVESKIVRKHIKEREEAEKAGRIIIDAPATRASRRGDGGTPKKDPPKKAGWLADLQAKAEQIVRDAERRKNEGRR
jgi:YidC/Oxa1 family membrane protein insertase